MPKRIDLTGMKFGMLTVTGYAGPSTSGAKWFCDCDCGKTGIIVLGNNLRSGKSKSCGCVRRKSMELIGKDNAIPKVNIGDRYGDYVVLKRSGGSNSRYVCKCTKCGAVVTLTRTELVSGENTECGKCHD